MHILLTRLQNINFFQNHIHFKIYSLCLENKYKLNFLNRYKYLKCLPLLGRMHSKVPPFPSALLL